MDVVGLLRNVTAELQRKLDRIDEAFIHEKSIDQRTYTEQRDKVRAELMQARANLRDAERQVEDAKGRRIRE